MSIDLGFANINIVVFIVISFISLYILWTQRSNIGIKNDTVFDIYLITTLLGLLFSRLFHIILNLSEYTGLGWTLYPYYLAPGEKKVWFSQDPLIFFRVWDGGFNYLGAVVGALVGIYIITRYLQIKSERIPYLFLPFAILGFTFNVFLLGREYFASNNLNFSSTSFYEALIYLAIVGIIILTPKKFYSHLWILIVGGFGVMKILVDERVKSNKVIWNLSIYQVIGLIALIFVALIIVYTLIRWLLQYLADNKARKLRASVISSSSSRIHEPSFVQRKSYSLSFKDMDSISLGSRLLTPIYAIRRKFSKNTRKIK